MPQVSASQPLLRSSPEFLQLSTNVTYTSVSLSLLSAFGVRFLTSLMCFLLLLKRKQDEKRRVPLCGTANEDKVLSFSVLLIFWQSCVP